VALFANEVQFSRFRVFFGACSLQNEVGVPHFFAFLVKVDHYLSAWQVLKKYVRGNILSANVLNSEPDDFLLSGISSAEIITFTLQVTGGYAECFASKPLNQDLEDSWAGLFKARLS